MHKHRAKSMAFFKQVGRFVKSWEHLSLTDVLRNHRIQSLATPYRCTCNSYTSHSKQKLINQSESNYSYKSTKQ